MGKPAMTDESTQPPRRLDDAPAFRKHERRLGRVEQHVDDLRSWRREAQDLLQTLRDQQLVAAAIAETMDGERRGRFTHREQLIALGVLCVMVVNSALPYLR